MNTEIILEKLNNMLNQDELTEEDVSSLSEWYLSPDDEIRILVAQVSVLSNSPAIQKILLILSKDSNYLVRANACDSLCIFPNETVLHILKKISRTDKSNLVKSYAILSILEIMQQLDKKKVDYYMLQYNEFYKQLSEKNSSPVVQCACFCILYYWGNKSCLQKLFNLLDNRFYTVRCFVLNSLLTIATRENAMYINKQIDKLLVTEKTKSVKSTALELKKSLNHIND